MTRHTTILFTCAILASCTPARPTTTKSLVEPFSPAAFFVGKTEGEGVFKKLLTRGRPTRVYGTGSFGADGTTVLEQRIEVARKAVRRRSWRLRSIGGGRYAGTLSDAVGPVTGEVSGDLFHVRFAAKGGYQIEQWMRLEPGGRVVLNHLVVRKFGIRVASLDETIRKVD